MGYVKMLKLLQLFFVQVVFSGSSTDSDVVTDYDPNLCENNLTVSYDCSPKIFSINYPVIKKAKWKEILCCGGCTPEQCCDPEKWWLTIPILCAYVLIIIGYLF